MHRDRSYSVTNPGGRVYVVRMGMPVSEAAELADLLPRLPADVRERVQDQLWLRTILIEQRRRTMLGRERETYDARGDRLLEALDPQEPEPGRKGASAS